MWMLHSTVKAESPAGWFHPAGCMPLEAGQQTLPGKPNV